MRIPDYLLVHSVTVKPYLGRSSTGKVYGDPFPLACFAEGKRRMVRDSGGTERMSELTLVAAPGRSAEIPPDSIVTWQGDDTEVIASTNRDSGGLGAPDHTEVVCA